MIKALLRLEDGSQARPKIFGGSFTGHLGAALYSGIIKHKRPWVAHLNGFDIQYVFKREFLHGQMDYTEANSSLSRYVYQNFILERGNAYEVSNPMARNNSAYKERKFFCTVTLNGEIKIITKNDVRGIISTKDFLRG